MGMPKRRHVMLPVSDDVDIVYYATILKPSRLVTVVSSVAEDMSALREPMRGEDQ